MNATQHKPRLTFLTLAIVLVAILLLSVSGVQSQEEAAIPVTIGFYGAQNAPSARGMQVAVQEMQAFGAFEGADGNLYEIVDIVSEDMSELQDATLILAIPESPESEDVYALDMPIIMLSPDADLALPNIEGTYFRGMTATNQLYQMLGDFAVRFARAERVTLIGDPLLYENFYADYSEYLNSVDQTGNLTIQNVAADIPSIEELDAMIAVDPQVVVYRGVPENAGAIMAALNAGGWEGVLVYDKAFEAAEEGVLLPIQGVQVVGMTPWSNSFDDPLSESFKNLYIEETGSTPNARSVSAYDVSWALRVLVRRLGSDPQTLTAALPTIDLIQTTQGSINIAEYGGEELYRSGAIYELTDIGGTNILARYDDGKLLLDDPVVAELPSPTPPPSATPSLPVVTVTGNGVNVRSGPGLNYDRIGFLEAGLTVGVLGTTPDYSWFYIQASNGMGWVKAEFVFLFNPQGGVNGISLVPIPPTPTPGATATVGQPDLVIDNVILTPERLVVGQPFQATVSIRNAGVGASGSFDVSTIWNPGNVASSVNIPSLEAFGTVSAVLQATLTQTGSATVQIQVDPANAVVESNEGNNLFALDYVVDAEPTIIATNTFAVGHLNFAGAMPDIFWSGTTLETLNGATFGIINGIEFDDVHVGLLGAAAIVQPAVGTIAPNTVFGMRTGEGHCGVFRIESQVGANITLSWRMYAVAACA